MTAPTDTDAPAEPKTAQPADPSDQIPASPTDGRLGPAADPAEGKRE